MAPGQGPPGLAQRFAQPAPGRLEGRGEAEYDPRDQRNAKCKREHPAIDTNHLDARNLSRGRQSDQGRHAPDRQQDAGRPTRQSYERAFCQQLPYQPPAAGAKSGAHCHLKLSAGRPREKQIGYVRARDQQYESDCARENHE